MPTPSARRFRQADAIFDAALDLEPAEREVFVDRACEGDPALLQVVRRLLRAHDQAEGFLGEAALELARPILEATAPPATAASEPIPAAVGPWRPLRELGRGGMGVVYLAVRDDAPAGEPVALKVLRGGAEASGSALRRFLAERQILAALAHPHVAPLLDAGIAPGGAPYFAMAHCAGGSLADLLARGALPVGDAVRIARELALALAAAHAHGIVHRDVKPGNVLLDRAGRVQLTDFGIAKLLDQESTQSGALVGTPAYLAPEQLRGAPIDARTDLWALGVNLYHMLTGVRPFDGPSHAATMHAILATHPLPVRRHAPGVPEPLEALVARLLEKDPAARPASAAEVAAALEAGTPAAAPWTPTPSAPSSTSTGRALNTSLVVMPFSPSEPDTYDAALCDGLTEELTAALARTPGLRVTARATADVLRARGLDARAIGNVLGVAHLVEGRVRRDGDRLAVAVRLLRTRDGSLKWSGTFDEALRDYFVLQAELGRAIVGALLPAIESDDTAPIPPPRDPDVQEAYLKGRHFLLKRTPPDLARAAEYFREATAHDPGFAEAEAGYAETQLFLVLFGTLDPAVGVPATRAALERASASGDLAAVHAARGNFLFTFEWDWAGGEEALRRALELDPACTDAALYLAQNLQNVGRFEESIAFARGMLQTDPLSPLVNLALGRAYLHARRTAEAVQPLRTAVEIAPGFMYAYLQLGHAYLRLARADDALESLRRAAELNPGHALGHLAHAHAQAGERAEAERLLQRLLAMEGVGTLSPLGVAVAHAGLGDADAAFAWLERGERGRAAFMNTIYVAPGFEAIRHDPRWTALMRRMRFPQAAG